MTQDVLLLCVAVYTLSQLFRVEGELSAVARQGSGSACRSLYGGFVQWKLGERSDGRDSIAEQVESESYWPELRVLILVVSCEEFNLRFCEEHKPSLHLLLYKHPFWVNRPQVASQERSLFTCAVCASTGTTSDYDERVNDFLITTSLLTVVSLHALCI